MGTGSGVLLLQTLTYMSLDLGVGLFIFLKNWLLWFYPFFIFSLSLSIESILIYPISQLPETEFSENFPHKLYFLQHFLSWLPGQHSTHRLLKNASSDLPVSWSCGASPVLGGPGCLLLSCLTTHLHLPCCLHLPLENLLNFFIILSVGFLCQSSFLFVSSFSLPNILLLVLHLLIWYSL